MPTIIDDETARQILLSEPATIPPGHPEAVTRPSWQTRPCPPWCSTLHQEDDFVADRSHDTMVGAPIDLTLYDGLRYGGEYEPGDLNVSITQYYREAEPTVGLILPKHELGDPRVTGEFDLDLTVDEARALRDRLSLILAMVDGAPLDAVLGNPIDGAIRRSTEHATRFGHSFDSDVTITSNLIQWVERGSSQEIEVEVDIASNPASCSPAQARGIAAQLREAAANIDHFADHAEKANAATGGRS